MERRGREEEEGKDVGVGERSDAAGSTARACRISDDNNGWIMEAT